MLLDDTSSVLSSTDEANRDRVMYCEPKRADQRMSLRSNSKCIRAELLTDCETHVSRIGVMEPGMCGILEPVFGD